MPVATVALINSLGNLAGYISPEMVAYLKKNHDMSMALNGIAAMVALSAVAVLCGRMGPVTRQR